MPKVVLDTNVLVSAFLLYDRGGLPAELLRHAREQRFTLIASELMLDELCEDHVEQGSGDADNRGSR